MTCLLIVPGLGGSGPEHWQTQWEAIDPRCTRVEQRDWDVPDRDEWVHTLARAVAAQDECVLVAHSLGCITVAHWALHGHVQRVRGALLVAPADVEHGLALQAVPPGFAPIPMVRLPFPSILVASTDDPYATAERAAALARAWGSALVDVGAQGHVNAASKLGIWEQGRALMTQLL